MSYRYFQSHVPRTSLISSQICSSLSLPHLSEYTIIYPVFPTRNLGFTDQLSSPLPLTFLPCSFLVCHLRFLYLCLQLLMFSKVLSWFLFFQCHTLFLGGLSCIHGFSYHLHAHRPQSVLQAQASFPNSSPIQQVLHVPRAQLVTDGMCHFSASHPANAPSPLISILETGTPETLLLQQEIEEFSLISLSFTSHIQAVIMLYSFYHPVTSLHLHCYCVS